MIKEIAFTSHRVSDLARSRKFFEDVLQLQPVDGDGENFQEDDVSGNVFSIHTFGPENVIGLASATAVASPNAQSLSPE